MKKITFLLLLFLCACNGQTFLHDSRQSSEPVILFCSEQSGHQEFIIVSPSGEVLRKLSFTPLPEKAIVANPIWSRKNNKFFFNVLIGNDSEIYSSNWDGNNAQNLTNSPDSYDGEFVLSPDETRIVFTRAFVGPSLAIFELKSGKMYPLLPDQIQAMSPVWPEQGKYIFFKSIKDGSPNIFKVRPDGKDNINISHGKGLDSFFSLSSDGKELVFDSDRNGRFQIYLTNVETGEISQLTEDSFRNYQPVISPNGRFVLFQSDRDNGRDIYLLNLQTKSISNITNDPEVKKTGYLWSPDSSKFLYIGTINNQQDVFVVDIENQKSINLTDSPYNEYSAKWLEP